MRIQLKNLRDVTVANRINPAGADEDKYHWDILRLVISAMIQPARRELRAKVYGEADETTLYLYYNGKHYLTAGLGVCVDVSGADSCDYLISSVENWPMHQKAILKRISENLRG